LFRVVVIGYRSPFPPSSADDLTATGIGAACVWLIAMPGRRRIPPLHQPDKGQHFKTAPADGDRAETID
jgi:hypothetical protein